MPRPKLTLVPPLAVVPIRPAWATNAQNPLAESPEVVVHTAIVGDRVVLGFDTMERDALVVVMATQSESDRGDVPAGQAMVDVSRAQTDGTMDTLLLTAADARAVALLLLNAANLVDPQ